MFSVQKGDGMIEPPADRWIHAEWYGTCMCIHGCSGVRSERVLTGGKDEPGKYHCTKAGFINGIDQFDPLEFGISAKEAAHFDPAIRLTLEAAHAVSVLPSALTSQFMFHLGTSRFWYRLQGFQYWCFLWQLAYYHRRT